MSYKNFTLTVISAFILTACGGSHHSDSTGGNGYYVNGPSNPNSGNTTVTEPFKLKEQFSSFTSSVAEDGTASVTKKTTADSWAGSSRVSVENLAQSSDGVHPVVNGIYQTDYQNEDTGELGDIIFGATEGTRGAAYARYGIDMSMSSAKENETVNTLFYVCEETTTMPTTGSVTYLGKTIAANPNVMEEIRNTRAGASIGNYYGDSSFEVDFGSKKLTGILNNWQSDGSTMPIMKPVSIEADIKANTFQGTANSTGYAEGKFYGPDAANIAGSFDDKDQGLFGVFGANKQE